MVQQYLEKPHTMRDRKHVLRLYVLIASIEPLRVYLYEQGFAKLASEPYDVNDADNICSQSHVGLITAALSLRDDLSLAGCNPAASLNDVKAIERVMETDHERS